jgi:hypothetical protein
VPVLFMLSPVMVFTDVGFVKSTTHGLCVLEAEDSDALSDNARIDDSCLFSIASVRSDPRHSC